MKATITGYQNYGTIVRLCINKYPYFIDFDHRPFWNMFEAEQGNLKGRKIEYKDDTIKFLDN